MSLHPPQDCRAQGTSEAMGANEAGDLQLEEEVGFVIGLQIDYPGVTGRHPSLSKTQGSVTKVSDFA